MITSMTFQVNNPEKRVYIGTTPTHNGISDSVRIGIFKNSKKNVKQTKTYFSVQFSAYSMANDRKLRRSRIKASPAESFQNLGFPLSHNSP